MNEDDTDVVVATQISPQVVGGLSAEGDLVSHIADSLSAIRHLRPLLVRPTLAWALLG